MFPKKFFAHLLHINFPKVSFLFQVSCLIYVCVFLYDHTIKFKSGCLVDAAIGLLFEGAYRSNPGMFLLEYLYRCPNCPIDCLLLWESGTRVQWHERCYGNPEDVITFNAHGTRAADTMLSRQDYLWHPSWPQHTEHWPISALIHKSALSELGGG